MVPLSAYHEVAVAVEEVDEGAAAGPSECLLKCGTAATGEVTTVSALLLLPAVTLARWTRLVDCHGGDDRCCCWWFCGVTCCCCCCCCRGDGDDCRRSA